jgi:hypothetical protein
MAESSVQRKWVNPVAALLVLCASSRMTRLLYKPFGLLIGVLAARLAGRLFTRLWEFAAHESASPVATDRDRGWGEVTAAAVIRGAVFSGVRAVVDRAGAAGFERVTGSWPGRISTRRLPPGSS